MQHKRVDVVQISHKISVRLHYAAVNCLFWHGAEYMPTNSNELITVHQTELDVPSCVMMSCHASTLFVS